MINTIIPYLIPTYPVTHIIIIITLIPALTYTPLSASTTHVEKWYCGEPAISLHSHHVSLVQWTTRLLPVTRGPGFKSPGGYLCETGILLLALSRYIGDPDHWLRHPSGASLGFALTMCKPT
jgi:hypothetical protein